MAIKEFRQYIAVLEEAMTRTEPMSLRARVLTSMQRFAERAERHLIATPDKSIPPYRKVGTMLEVRDMARTEQAWIDSLLRDEVYEREHEDALLLYKMLLAVVEASLMAGLAYLTTDRENTGEAGWWGGAAGGAIMETLGIVPHLLVLPMDRRPDPAPGAESP